MVFFRDQILVCAFYKFTPFFDAHWGHVSIVQFIVYCLHDELDYFNLSLYMHVLIYHARWMPVIYVTSMSIFMVLARSHWPTKEEVWQFETVFSLSTRSLEKKLDSQIALWIMLKSLTFEIIGISTCTTLRRYKKIIHLHDS